MKVVIISDIHGNFQALEAVLADAKDCERVFCCGDLALAGPEPARTIDFIREQNWEIIQGNCDLMMTEDDTLNAEQREFLRNLPKQKELEIEGVKILLVHGSPRAQTENIYPDMTPEQVEEMIAGVDADVIFCGHTHRPAGYQLSKTVVNVGTVGRPLPGNPTEPCYVVAEFADSEFSIEHRFVDYHQG
jgi:putative phosphoesterase